MTKHAAGFCCIDGRVLEAVIAHMRRTHGVDWVDMVTAPGINRILADDMETVMIHHMAKAARASVLSHGSKIVAIVGHPDCAGNPADKAGQIEHLRRAQKTVEGFDFGAKITVTLLWVCDDWKTVEVITPE